MPDLAPRLAELEAQSLLRRRRTVDAPCGPEAVLDGRPFIAFASNDYLGLANHPALVEAAREGAARWGVGAGASHLVSGHLAPHALLEAALARFMDAPRALAFSTGYMANLGIVPALVGRGDAVFADKLNHASLVDAALLSRATLQRYPHGDLAALERQLAASTAPAKLIATDGVFSMDGDVAPLAETQALARRHDAWLLVDDAHGFGVLGPGGRGSLAHLGVAPDWSRLLYMGTLGKAAGVAGAFVAGSGEAVEWLLQRARTYIFTTASPPLLAWTLLEALRLIEAGDELRARLQAHVRLLREGLRPGPWRLLASDTAIQPLIIGVNEEALRVSAALYDRGLWVPAIRPPTVPRGEARLRISLSAAHAEAQVRQLVDALNGLQ